MTTEESNAHEIRELHKELTTLKMEFSESRQNANHLHDRVEERVHVLKYVVPVLSGLRKHRPVTSL